MKSHQRMMAKAAPITPLKQTLKEAEHIKYNVAKSLALEQQDDIPGEELLNLRCNVSFFWLFFYFSLFFLLKILA